MKNLTIIEQLDGNQFTFYDNRLGSILNGFEGFEYPTVRPSIDDVAGEYGAVYVNSKYGTRRAAVRGDLVSDDVFGDRRLLLKALRQTGEIKLIKFQTYDDLLLQFEAEVIKVANPYTHKVHSFLIELLAPDWRFYSQEQQAFLIDRTYLAGGTSIPAIIPMSFPLSTNPETQINSIVTNAGSEVTDPEFLIDGPGEDFTIRNVTTDKEFTLATVLGATDQIIVDVRNRTAILNGTTNVYSDLGGELWSLVPGENEMRFFIGSGFSELQTSLIVRFRDAYGGV